jgi:lipopolysaccharide transport system ATP-binding protein
MASLLEVGTGFHPELTGRENIFLNGAILGMSKQEIKRKLDEIIDFSGCALYIDTPVKRYSSGMTVRLGFAVAAFLDPEILIVDEVLAVGDAEFQKKAIGKMKDVSEGEGRTVLFVSHNMAAVQQLCTKGLLIDNGQVTHLGDIRSVIENYINKSSITTASVIFDSKTIRLGNGSFRFEWIKIEDKKGKLRNDFSIGEDVICTFQLRNTQELQKAELSLQVKSPEGMPIFHMMCRDSLFTPIWNKSEETFTVIIEDLRLFPGDYYLTLTCASTEGHEIYDNIEDAISFTVLDGGNYTSRSLPKAAGLFFMNPKWQQE